MAPVPIICVDKPSPSLPSRLDAGDSTIIKKAVQNASPVPYPTNFR
jgi:hypothetical protein